MLIDEQRFRHDLRNGLIRHLAVDMVLLRCAPVVMEDADLPIEPITRNQITQIALWGDSQKSPVVDFFIGCLNKFAVDQPQM